MKYFEMNIVKWNAFFKTFWIIKFLRKKENSVLKILLLFKRVATKYVVKKMMRFINLAGVF